MNKTMAQLQEADLPHATCESIGLALKPNDDTEETKQVMADAIAEINGYLKGFATGPNCPGCGSKLGGMPGTFFWGIRTGEGACSNCRYPARAQHACKSMSGLNTILPYHPDLLVAYPGSPDCEGEKLKWNEVLRTAEKAKEK